MDYLQKSVTYSKSLVHLSKVSIYVNEQMCLPDEGLCHLKKKKKREINSVQIFFSII